jgi:alanyl-tRNA synthetase
MQKCFRALDIDIIGTTQRHLTFFEMMGNFSFGDYFKEGAIRYAWGLITEGFGLDPERSGSPCTPPTTRPRSSGATSSACPPSRIQRLGEDNFWEMGRRDRADRARRSSSTRAREFGADGGPELRGEDRFVEFWNLVFTQYDQGPDGTMTELPKKNIDTGAGFERDPVDPQRLESVFATDLFAPLLETASRAIDVNYGRRRIDRRGDPTHRRARTRHDDARRRRRAALERGTRLRAASHHPSRHPRGAPRRFRTCAHASLVDATIEKMGGAYPVLVKDRDLIVEVLEREEAGFARTLKTGLSSSKRPSARCGERSRPSFPGDVAFKLHDTHGFPDRAHRRDRRRVGTQRGPRAFDAAMSDQRERARSKAKTLNLADDAQYRDLIERHGTTEFVGRDVTRYSVETDGAGVLVGRDGVGELFLDATPFYAESGGQVADTGSVVTETGRFKVLDVQNVAGGLFAHRGLLTGDCCPARWRWPRSTRAARGDATQPHRDPPLARRLRTVLGDHVRQQGSFVGPDRLRFDFSHGAGVTPRGDGRDPDAGQHRRRRQRRGQHDPNDEEGGRDHGRDRLLRRQVR